MLTRLPAVIFLLYIVVTTFRVTSAAALELTEEEEKWLSDHPVIRVGVDPAWPPYEFIDEQGIYRGIGADYLALLSEKLGVHFQVSPAQTWTTTQTQLKQKNKLEFIIT